MPSTLIQDYMGYWQDELDSATLYREVSETERNPKLANVYRRLAQTEQRHAEVWAEQIRAKGGSVPAFRPSWRTRILCQLARRFGTAMVLPSLATREQTGLQTYKHQPDAQALLADEHSHSRLLRQIGQTMRGGMEGGLLAELEGRHRMQAVMLCGLPYWALTMASSQT